MKKYQVNCYGGENLENLKMIAFVDAESKDDAYEILNDHWNNDSMEFFVHEIEPNKEYLMWKIREAMGVESDDSTLDDVIDLMTNNEIFDYLLNYEGIIGYGERILDCICDIYGVDLRRIY